MPIQVMILNQAPNQDPDQIHQDQIQGQQDPGLVASLDQGPGPDQARTLGQITLRMKKS